VRRVGVLVGMAADDPLGQARISALQQGLQQSGWTKGRDLRIDTRWGRGDADLFRRYAAELVALAPDVILTSGTAPVTALLQTTRVVPIVFAGPWSGTAAVPAARGCRAATRLLHTPVMSSFFISNLPVAMADKVAR